MEVAGGNAVESDGVWRCETKRTTCGREFDRENGAELFWQSHFIAHCLHIAVRKQVIRCAPVNSYHLPTVVRFKS